MKQTQKSIIVILGFLLYLGMVSHVNAQTTWYFGNGAGIKFPGGSAAPIATPTTSAMNTGEGSSVLVDQSNNVIMYTDGITVWNGSHQPQGAPTYTLSGHSSATQSALIVPIPATSGTQAFIFTVNAAETAYGNATRATDQVYGLRVSLATITGAAPNYSITITPANMNQRITPANELMSERLSVTEDGKGGYWVLTHGVGAFYPLSGVQTGLITGNNSAQPGESTFYAYHVTCATTTIPLLDVTEVSSTFASPGFTPHRSWDHPFNNLDLGNLSQTIGTAQAQINSQGQLKFSLDGKKVACTLPWTGNIQGSTGWLVSPVCQLFDFNLTTGVVGGTNKVEFNLGFINADNSTKDGSAAGLEFSPDGNYLYITSTLGSGRLALANNGTTATSMTSRIYRYPISTWVPGVKQLVRALPASNIAGFAYLQLGPDGRIYVARPNTNYLDVIANPNHTSVASCGYQTIPTAGTPTLPANSGCTSGLPASVLVNKNTYVPNIVTASSYCAGSPISVTGSYTGETPSYTYWEIAECNSSGVITPGGYTWGQWFPGVPGAFTFPNSASLPCNKYYQIKLAFSNACHEGWVATSKIIFVACYPTPVITSSSPNPVCYGSTITLCVNYSPSSAGIYWWNDIYSGPIYPNGPSCTGTKPLQDLMYHVRVTVNGCAAVANYQVIMEKNSPDFSLAGNLPSTSSPYYTITATPLISPPSYVGVYWEVSEIDQVTGNVIPGTTVVNPDCWWTPVSVNNFLGYNYTISGAGGYNSTNNTGTAFNGPANGCINPNAGRFQAGRKYKVTRGTWTATCPWQQVSATIRMCGNCRSADGSPFIVEKTEVSTVNTTQMGKSFAAAPAYEVSIHSNPSNGLFVLNLPGEEEKNVLVYDINGRVVFKKDKTTDTAMNIDITHEAPGIYLVKVIAGEQVITKKVIVQ